MKNKWILALLLLIAFGFSSQNLAAQKMYLSLDAGYGTKISTQDNSWYYTNIDAENGVHTYEVVRFSLGQGTQAGASFGYMFTENMGFELKLSFLAGTPCKAHYNNVDTSTNVFSHMSYSFGAKMVRINPSLFITTGSGKLRPYMKFGFIFSKGSLEEIHEGTDYSGDFIKRTYLYNKGAAFGLSSAVGTTFAISDKISLFGEIHLINMSYSPKKMQLTECSENGLDVLPSMSAEDKESVFVESYDFDFNNQPPATEPRTELERNYSLNSVGLNLGVRLSF